MNPKPLTGIRVLDFTRFLAGPYGTMLLGDLGAEVLKIEDRRGGDPLRVQGPPMYRGEGLTFHASNRNKQSLQLDLKNAGDLAAARELCKVADVLVENFRPGVMAQYGLEYAAVQALNPRLIYVSASGYGADGPLAEKGAFDITIQAYAGYMSITGEPDRPPVKPGTSAFDLLTGMNVCTGVLAALLHRQLTGQGQCVQTSLLEGQVAFLANAGLEHLYGFGVPGRLGSDHPQLVPYKVFTAADGFMVIGAGVQNIFEALARALGRVDLIKHPSFASLERRLANRAEVNATIDAETRKYTMDDLARLLDAAGVPCSPVNTIDKVFESEQVRHRGMLATVSAGTADEAAAVGPAIKYSGFDVSAGWTAPPKLGAGGREVADRWLSASRT